MSNAQPRTIIDGVEHKKCSVCRQWLPASPGYFYRVRLYPRAPRDGLESRCKGCTLACTKIKQARYRAEWRKVLKTMGYTKCSVCGYDKCFAAIEFHHPDPKKKDFQPGAWLSMRPTEKKIEKFKTLTPLCANCHREIHHR